MRPNIFTCPMCESGELVPEGPQSLVRCNECERTLSSTVLTVIHQIVSLPDALGAHPCECGHPEMRRLPDDVFHCPACRSEVIPTESSTAPADAG